MKAEPASISALFLLSALLTVKTEHSTRQIVRQEIGPNLTRLIEIINLICAEILAQTGRPVLVVVEDMDKPSLTVSRRLFEESLVNLTQPACSIVYTVPVAIYFDPTYTQIQDTSFFLPNIKLHPKGQPDTLRPAGVKIMRHLGLVRMNEALISSEALDAAIQASGGVFREMTLLMQRSIDNALNRDGRQVELEDVRRTMAQRRSEFRRLLSDDDYRLLLAVRTSNEMRHPDKLAALLHLLAVLEYNGEDNWCDVHPVLHPLLDELAATLGKDEAGKMIE